MAIELLIIARGIEFSKESRNENSMNLTSTNVIMKTNTAKRMNADNIDLMIRPFLFLLISISRLASITIIISPKVPITGSSGLILGIEIPVDVERSCMPIPRAISKITPGIFENLLEISKM